MSENIHTPLISVLLPVYNGQKFLNEAIQSILGQSYVNFELIIINDGSTDNSESLVKSFTDKRILYIKNEKNQGLISVLNNGIKAAKGTFIARMDADDVSHKERLEIQLKCFEKYPKAAMVCSPVSQINSNGKLCGMWQADVLNKTLEQIRNTLPYENCIAHPTVMMKAEVAKKYLYNTKQKASEDWDLWLRLIADNLLIVKTDEILLNYRIHTSSITVKHNANEPGEIKAAKVKWNFLWGQFYKLKLNSVFFKVKYSLLRTWARHLKLNVVPRILQNVKRILTINPFSALKQYRFLKNALNGQNSGYFLFFPYSHVGGAEKVHADIVKAIGDKKPLVFFTGIHNLKDYSSQFGKEAVLINVNMAVNYPFCEKSSRNLILNKITGTRNALVFGCSNIFFYDLIPFLPLSVNIIDLTHDFRFEGETNLTHTYFNRYSRCSSRVFVSNRAIEQTKKFYETNCADDELYDRLKLVVNGTDLPKEKPIKKFQLPLQVLYVGRDTEEKRVNLVFKVAQMAEKQSLKVNFTLIGKIKARNEFSNLKNLKLAGEILEKAKLNSFYANSHVVLITSYKEGFPLAIMEGMAYAAVPVSTPVGDIPYHIKNNSNGFYTSSVEEKETLNEILRFLKTLSENETVFNQLSNNAYNYAEKHFTKEKFVSEYRKLFGV